MSLCAFEFVLICRGACSGSFGAALSELIKNRVGGEEELGVCIALMLVGLSVFAIGVVKSVKSKCTDLTAVTWLWSGVALINIGTILAGAL